MRDQKAALNHTFLKQEELCYNWLTRHIDQHSYQFVASTDWQRGKQSYWIWAKKHLEKYYLDMPLIDHYLTAKPVKHRKETLRKCAWMRGWLDAQFELRLFIVSIQEPNQLHYAWDFI